MSEFYRQRRHFGWQSANARELARAHMDLAQEAIWRARVCDAVLADHMPTPLEAAYAANALDEVRGLDSP